jgi:hypothetical protein
MVFSTLGTQQNGLGLTTPHQILSAKQIVNLWIELSIILIGFLLLQLVLTDTASGLV